MYVVTNTTTFFVECLLLLRHNYMFQPSVLAIFRLYVRNLSTSYTNVWGVHSLWGGCEILFCVGERGVDRGCLGNCVKVTSMSTYSYV